MRSSSPRRRPSGSPVSRPASVDDLVARGAQPCGGAAQERRAGGAVAQRRIVERALGRLDGGGDVGGRRLVVAGDGLAGAGIDGVEGRRHVVYRTGPVIEPVIEQIGPLAMPQRYERIAERLAADIRAGPARARRAAAGGARARAAAGGRPRVGARGDRGAGAAGRARTRPGAGSFVADDALERLAPGEARRPRRQPVRPARGAAAARAGRRRARRAPRPPRPRAPSALLDAMDAAEAAARPRRAGTTATASSTASSPR